MAVPPNFHDAHFTNYFGYAVNALTGTTRIVLSTVSWATNAITLVVERTRAWLRSFRKLRYGHGGTPLDFALARNSEVVIVRPRAPVSSFEPAMVGGGLALHRWR